MTSNGPAGESSLQRHQHAADPDGSARAFTDVRPHTAEGIRWILQRLVLPVLCAVAIAAIIEVCIGVVYKPAFWQRTTYLMYDPYIGENFDRVELYVRLSHLQDSNPDIISVGDSSGFFSLQSRVINRYMDGLKFLSLNTGANMAYAGYQGIAEYMLRRSDRIKYVVLYLYPQLLPQEGLFQVADLGPIVHEDLDGTTSYVTPPSAFLSPYAKYGLFEGRRFHTGEPLTNQMPALQLMSTVDDALGWLPEFDVRYDRVNGRECFFSDRRSGWYNHLGLTDPSSINANLDAFDKVVRRYGAQLVIAFAPVADRVLCQNDPNVAIADHALERFQREHADVKFLFPLITRWGIEKFGMFNHISREYSFLSSERLGKALDRLIRDPASIPPYKAQAKVPSSYPPITAKPTGSPDRRLLAPALAFYLYTSTADPKYDALLSRRVQDLLLEEPAYQYAMEDARTRAASLDSRGVKIGFDLSQMRATPVKINGLAHCGDMPGRPVQWVQLDGTMITTYNSRIAISREPMQWPESAHVYVPTVVEGGARKFDGYCPEPSMTASPATTH